MEDRRPDWKSYALGELDARARQEAESHAAACADCQDELAGLRVTLDAMATLREEELPRRIAFVSDKVFEPRWYEKLTQSSCGPRSRRRLWSRRPFWCTLSCGRRVRRALRLKRSRKWTPRPSKRA